jgi:hypothetical protein
MLEEIRRLVSATPFQPFTLFLTDGRSFRVPTADHIFIYPSGLIGLEDDGGVVNFLRANQLTGVELQTQTAS